MKHQGLLPSPDGGLRAQPLEKKLTCKSVCFGAFGRLKWKVLAYSQPIGGGIVRNKIIGGQLPLSLRLCMASCSGLVLMLLALHEYNSESVYNTYCMMPNAALRYVYV